MRFTVKTDGDFKGCIATKHLEGSIQLKLEDFSGTLFISALTADKEEQDAKNMMKQLVIADDKKLANCSVSDDKEKDSEKLAGDRSVSDDEEKGDSSNEESSDAETDSDLSDTIQETQCF